MREPSDAEVLARSVDDAAAFRLLFDRHFAAVHRYLRHRAGEADAENLAAETFARAFARRADFHAAPGAGPRAWLFAIATNLLRDDARRRARSGRALRRLAAEPAAEPARADRPDAELAAALRALREEERDVLLLFAWADLGYEEIAAVMGVPTGTVRSRLHRARRRLRVALAEEIEEVRHG